MGPTKVQQSRSKNNGFCFFTSLNSSHAVEPKPINSGRYFPWRLNKKSVRVVSVGNDNVISIIACRSTHISLLEVVYHLSEFPSLRESRVLGLGPRDWKKAGFAKELSPEGRVQLLLWGGRSAATAAAAGGSGAGAGRTGSQHDLVQKDERRKT